MLVPHLHFEGSCAAAMDLYKKAFGASTDLLLFEDGDEKAARVLHAEMTIHGQRVMLNDNRSGETAADYPFAQMVVIFQSKEELLRAYDAMKEGSKTVAPVAETDYSPCTVGFWDRFGIRWGFMV